MTNNDTVSRIEGSNRERLNLWEQVAKTSFIQRSCKDLIRDKVSQKTALWISSIPGAPLSQELPSTGSVLPKALLP
jgi:hypothetical protein